MKRTSMRLLMLALAATLLMALAACGGKPEDVAGTIEPGPSASAAAPTGVVETTSPEEDETGDEEETPVSLGRMEGGVYTNSYAGFGCELDSNREFYTAEELQELPNNVKELLSDTEAGDLISDLTQIIDMKADNAEDLTSMNVLYTKLDAQERLSYLTLGEEGYLDAALEQPEMMDMMTSSFAQVGIEVDTVEKTEVDFLGEERFAVRTSGHQDDIPWFLLQIFDYSRGRYGVTISFSSYLEDRTQDLAALFYKVD